MEARIVGASTRFRHEKKRRSISPRSRLNSPASNSVPVTCASLIAQPQFQQQAQWQQNSFLGTARRTGGAGGSLFGGAVAQGSYGQPSGTALFGSAPKPQAKSLQASLKSQIGGLFGLSNSAASHFSQTPQCHASAPPPPAQSHSVEYERTLYKATIGLSQPLMLQDGYPWKLRSNGGGTSATPIQVDWTSKSESEKVLALIALQDFEGSWPYDKEVGQIMGFEIPQRPKGGEQKIWVTLLVVCFLEQKMSGEEGTWGLVVEKARGWLEGSGDMDLEDLEKNAKAFVIKN
jgi:hypothetical protein